jgi:hypothetical protein
MLGGGEQGPSTGVKLRVASVAGTGTGTGTGTVAGAGAAGEATRCFFAAPVDLWVVSLR